MKTQLLEDIGQSAALPLTPPKTVANAAPSKDIPTTPPARSGVPIELRAKRGVWRDRTAAQEPVATPPPTEPAAIPVALQSVFEEIAALEAQYVPPESPAESPPQSRPEPVVLLGELQTAFSAPPDEIHDRPVPFAAEPTLLPPAMKAEAAPKDPPSPVHPRPVVSPAQPTLAAPATQAAATPPDPLFDFNPPAPAADAAEPFTRPPGSTRSSRFLLWGAALLCVATLVQGGRWLYQERNDTGSLALLAGEAKGVSQANRGVAPRMAAAAQAEARPEVAVPDSRPASPPPPLVLLEPESSKLAPTDETAPSAAERTAPEDATALEPAKEEVPPPPVAKAQPKTKVKPKPASQSVRKTSGAPTGLAAKKDERKPARQPARASAPRIERPAPVDTSLAATLRACREHGYHATQCVKQGCSITEYGFVCRGKGRSG